MQTMLVIFLHPFLLWGDVANCQCIISCAWSGPNYLQGDVTVKCKCQRHCYYSWNNKAWPIGYSFRGKSGVSKVIRSHQLHIEDWKPKMFPMIHQADHERSSYECYRSVQKAMTVQLKKLSIPYKYTVVHMSLVVSGSACMIIQKAPCSHPRPS